MSKALLSWRRPTLLSSGPIEPAKKALICVVVALLFVLGVWLTIQHRGGGTFCFSAAFILAYNTFAILGESVTLKDDGLSMGGSFIRRDVRWDEIEWYGFTPYPQPSHLKRMQIKARRGQHVEWLHLDIDRRIVDESTLSALLKDKLPDKDMDTAFPDAALMAA